MTEELLPYACSMVDYDQVIAEVIEAYPDKVEALNKQPAVIRWFVGQVMRHTHGKANPATVTEKLKERFGL